MGWPKRKWCEDEEKKKNKGGSEDHYIVEEGALAWIHSPFLPCTHFSQVNVYRI